MLPILQNQSVITMSSREIAKLCGKRHDNTTQVIKSLLDGGILKNTTPSQWLNEQNNQHYVEWLSDKRDSLVIVARLSPEFTAALVDRWQELEAKPQFNIPQTLPEALRLAADLADQLAIAAPKIAFVDKYVDSTGLMGFRQVAKLLGIKENDFRAFLQDNNIMYRLGGDWVAYAPHIAAGRFSTKTGTATNGHTYNGALFTPKGVEWIVNMLSKK